MLKKLNLPAKIGGGFATVTLLLLLTALVAWFGMEQFLAGYNRFAEIVDRTTRAENIQANMLAAQLNSHDYLFEQDASYVKGYRESLQNARQAYQQLDALVRNPERRQHLEVMKTTLEAYDHDFSAVV